MKAASTFARCCALSTVVIGMCFAQVNPVPAAYKDLYSQLQTSLNSFDKTITSSWDGSTFSGYFSAELLTANGNRGIQLLQENAKTGAVAELGALRALGARAVVISLPYPLLNSTYLNSIGRGSDYQAYLSYYRYLAGEIYNRGMIMVIENGPMFPGVFSSGSGYDVAAHYASLTDAEYIAARSDMAAVIAREIQPNYLQLGAEPDTEAQLTGMSSLAGVNGYTSFVIAALAKVKAAGIPDLEVGAGVGTWIPNGADYIRAFAAAGVSFIDLHIYPVNGTILNTAIADADLAISLGKKVTICEAWLLKERDSELGTSSPAADPTIFARDPFSFWAPLDQQFLSLLIKFSHWKQISVVSAYWSKYLYAYLDYATESGKSPTDIINDSAIAAANAIVASGVSVTGTAYKGDVTAGTFVLSNSSYAGDRIAPGSIVSVFGPHLSTATDAIASSTAPAILGGTSVTVTDSAGAQSPALFYLASATQLNLVMPQGLAIGRGKMKITSADGVVSNASLDIAPVAPGISSANSTGRGVPAALVERVAADGTFVFQQVFDCSGADCTPKPIDLSGGDTFYLVLFGTGFRNRSSLGGVEVTLGTTALKPIFAGAQTQFPGLDQLNLALPKSLIGQGTLTLYVSVDGAPANRMTLNFL